MTPCTFALQSRRVPARQFRTRSDLLRGLNRVYRVVAATPAKPWTIAEMATLACLSRAHFVRAFRKTYGETPSAYRSRLRMEAAYAELVLGASVQEACRNGGFISLGSFSRDFRRRFGVSPSEIREKCIFAQMEK